MSALGIAQHLHSQSFLTGSILNGEADKTVSVDRSIERERESAHIGLCMLQWMCRSDIVFSRSKPANIHDSCMIDVYMHTPSSLLACTYTLREG